jgi:hypothetical protein
VAVYSLVPKLAGDKQISTLEHTQTRRYGDSVKVLDGHRPNFLSFVLDRQFEQVAIFGLQQEEEGALEEYQPIALIAKNSAHLDLVHDCSNDDDSPTGVVSLSEWITPSGYRHSVRIGIHVFPYDVILTADQHTRWSFPSIRLGILASGHCRMSARLQL